MALETWDTPKLEYLRSEQYRRRVSLSTINHAPEPGKASVPGVFFLEYFRNLNAHPVAPKAGATRVGQPQNWLWSERTGQAPRIASGCFYNALLFV